MLEDGRNIVTHRDLVLQMLTRIDLPGMRRTHEMFAGTTWDKFFDVQAFVHAAANHALRLNQSLWPQSKCLDVGCGFGYVALALECLGHPCVAWDVPARVLETVAQFLPIRDRMFLTITRDQRPLQRGFDLIFLHGVVPIRDSIGWWSWEDYAHLARTLLSDLNAGGMMEWICNRGDQIPVACNPAEWAGIMPHGMTCDVSDNSIVVRREGATVCTES
jgi:hypothetical protein